MIIFYPKKNAYKIDPKMVPDNVVCIEADATEPELKEILKQFSDLTGIPSLPTLDH